MEKNYKSIDIIGGGIIGTTLATELLREIKRRGLNTEVHLFERLGQLGNENTEKSFEGVRTYWFTPEEIRFYLFSIRAMRDLAGYFRKDIAFGTGEITARYRPVGYDYFLSQEEFDEALKRRALFESEGIPIEFHTKDEAKKIGWIDNNFDLDADVLDEDDWFYHHFDLDLCEAKHFDFHALIRKNPIQQFEIAGYVHVPIAGFVSAGELISSYRSIFEKLGGKLHLNTEVIHFETGGNRIRAFAHRPSLISIDSELRRDGLEMKSTDYVINTAGVWAEGLHQELFGECLGVTSHRRYPLIVKPPRGYQTDHGMVLLKQRVIRPDQDKIWLYFTPKFEKPGIQRDPPDDKTFDTYFFKYIYPVFCYKERPFIRNAETLGLYSGIDSRGWLGHYADTPDERPLIGVPSPDQLENYAVSTGYSGHGVQASIAAAVGLTHQILQLSDRPIVEIPEIYSASRNFSGTRPDQSRL